MISGASYCSVTEHGGIPVSPEFMAENVGKMMVNSMNFEAFKSSPLNGFRQTHVMSPREWQFPNGYIPLGTVRIEKLSNGLTTQ